MSRPGTCRRKQILRGLAGLALLLSGCSPDRLSPASLERVLNASWRSYVQHFISPEGRVVIPEQGGGTISEAQAYALLRAVWANDPATFARVYRWSKENLSREARHGDHLLSWQWGQKADGSWGVVDENTAADGDLDWALALCLAARRGWRGPPDLPDYLEEAGAVAADILKLETVTLANGELLLTPGNWHELEPPYLVNPSYFSPGAYRVFVQASGDRRWEQLNASTYALLARLARGWGEAPGIGLFPDWCRVDGSGNPAPAPGRGTDFGWEAVRLPFRLALEALWFREEAAIRLLSQDFLPFFQKEWQDRGRLAAVYHLDGTPAVTYESPVLYAGVLAAALAAGDDKFAGELAAKILSFYREEEGRAFFASPDNYYANNWAWLGLALYNGWVRVF
jgi:endo-1,4-beta-D-glucanase Y